MKKFFSSPVVAMILAVIVVVGSVVVNTRTKLGRQCDGLSEQFYYRADGQSSVASELRKLCTASERICSLARQYEIGEAEEAENTIGSLRSLLELEEKNLTHLHSYYDTLLSDTFRLESALAKADLSEDGRTLLSEAQHDAAAAKAAIDDSDYNDVVRSFLKRNTSFPTPQIAAFSGVSLPEIFA